MIIKTSATIEEIKMSLFTNSYYNDLQKQIVLHDDSEVLIFNKFMFKTMSDCAIIFVIENHEYYRTIHHTVSGQNYGVFRKDFGVVRKIEKEFANHLKSSDISFDLVEGQKELFEG